MALSLPSTVLRYVIMYMYVSAVIGERNTSEANPAIWVTVRKLVDLRISESLHTKSLISQLMIY